MVHGDLATVQREPNGIVITEWMAERFFGKEDPIGRPIEVDDLHFESNLKVPGVLRDPTPEMSWLFWFDAVMSTQGTEPARRYWGR